MYLHTSHVPILLDCICNPALAEVSFRSRVSDSASCLEYALMPNAFLRPRGIVQEHFE